MRPAFLCRASSITFSVKSLVRKNVFIVFGGLGSTSNPILSQLSADDRDVKSFKEEMSLQTHEGTGRIAVQRLHKPDCHGDQE